MRTLIILGLILAAFIGIGFAVAGPIANAIKEANKPHWRTVEVDEGDISLSVDSTGKVRPVLSIQIGAFVSGPIDKLYVEFNQEVEKGELLAEIDPRLYDAAVNRDQAALKTRTAELKRVKALLEQAQREETRALLLKGDDEEFISPSELDQYVYNRKALEAQEIIAEASIEQANASLENSLQNQDYTKIRAPEAGIIIDRKVEPGQTLTAQFQTPEMFTIAPRMREEMHIFADVDEVDIGKIIKAWDEKRPVKFTVDSYPGDLFTGTIAEVRYSSTETQNVVTYPVVVETTNPELKLLPGMTATLEFEIEYRKGVQRIPNSALRFLPDTVQHVHPDDHAIVEGTSFENLEDDGQEIKMTASEKQAAELRRQKRHVWYLDGEQLRALEITVGLSDNRYTEVVEGDLAGKTIVSGIKPKAGG